MVPPCKAVCCESEARGQQKEKDTHQRSQTSPIFSPLTSQLLSILAGECHLLTAWLRRWVKLLASRDKRCYCASGLFLNNTDCHSYRSWGRLFSAVWGLLTSWIRSKFQCIYRSQGKARPCVSSAKAAPSVKLHYIMHRNTQTLGWTGNCFLSVDADFQSNNSWRQSNEKAGYVPAWSSLRSMEELSYTLYGFFPSYTTYFLFVGLNYLQWNIINWFKNQALIPTLTKP